jgi:hypothetical protein
VVELQLISFRLLVQSSRLNQCVRLVVVEETLGECWRRSHPNLIDIVLLSVDLTVVEE